MNVYIAACSGGCSVSNSQVHKFKRQSRAGVFTCKHPHPVREEGTRAAWVLPLPRTLDGEAGVIALTAQLQRMPASL